MSAVRVTENVTFRISYPQHEWLETLQPFIADVGERIVATGDLKRSVLAARAAHPRAAEFFVIDPETVQESFALRPEFLFAEWEASALLIREGESFSEIDLGDVEGGLTTLRSIFSLAACGVHDRATIRRRLVEPQRLVFDLLMEDGLFTEAASRPSRLLRLASGVHRLQHASLLYRSRTTGILVDPHLHSQFGAQATDFDRRDLEGTVDAILITHFHEDHWCLSTLLMFPRDTPIVVPKVPRSSTICGDMAALLRRCGFVNVFAVDWWDPPLKFGEFEVHVLPFYGEQPLRFEHPSDANLRNWGNTYVIRNEDYSSWILVDSGNDARGSMRAVAERVRERVGPIDMVLSNLRSFCVFSPLYIDGGMYWTTLSPAQKERLPSMGSHLLTLAPSGVAEVCAAVDAAFYLPYAHWWGEPGSVPGVHGAPETEGVLLGELDGHLRAVGARTRIIAWGIGDAVECSSRRGPVRRAYRG
ncbi:MBL fold metallo-hydrolase [Nannocystis radixulma]|uniref:MBL fold metallo-hydrolase n=1 Tax=Nannocystis radixulma TaxID=2995305 RepID=A0ABT5B3B3_9BACT|nr:MBL fold metallo-hydrolase [Nannocystis radixulma]MDC0668585.1 MBL fold metallo-hydrolase [Nannocystis radixulma]